MYWQEGKPSPQKSAEARASGDLGMGAAHPSYWEDLRGGGLCVHSPPASRKQHFREALVELKESDNLTRVLNGMTTSHLPRKGSTLACCQIREDGDKAIVLSDAQVKVP